MLTDEEIAALPDAPEEAFVQFARLAQLHLQERQERSAQREHVGWDDEVEYMGAVIGAAKVYGIDSLSDWSLPVESDNVRSDYESFRHAVAHIAIQLRLRNAQRSRRSAVSFDPAAKVKLRHLLNQMREMVDKETQLTPRKRDALYARIADLSAEIDSDWSRVESYGQLAIEIADSAGEAAGKLEPFRKISESIAGVFGKARREQQDSLPPIREPKRIEGPKPARHVTRTKVDDEIPF